MVAIVLEYLFRGVQERGIVLEDDGFVFVLVAMLIGQVMVGMLS
jgi:hypothetical protein